MPIHLVLDVSESMAGDNLRQLQHGLERLVASLRTDPHALESVYLSTIAFAGKARAPGPPFRPADGCGWRTARGC